MLKITGKIDKLIQHLVEMLKGDNTGLYDLEIKEHKEKRSLDANAYCWVLCDKLAKKLKSTKEEIYREAIQKVGTFETLPIKNEALDKFILRWTLKGLGWVCESLGTSKLDGYTNVLAYYGSSSYDKKEMSILIDYIVEECKEQEIETLTPFELQKMKEEWE